MGTYDYLRTRYPHCQFVLPAVFNDSLTYYESICKLYKHYNDLVDAFNAVQQTLTDESKAYTDEQIALSIANYRIIADNLAREFAEFKNIVNSNIILFQQQLDTTAERLENEIIGVNARTDVAIAQNNDYILQVIGEGLVDLKVLNYFTGKYVTVQEMFDYLAQFHLTNAITYEQIRTKSKTYNQIANYNATYTELAVNGGNIIM